MRRVLLLLLLVAIQGVDQGVFLEVAEEGGLVRLLLSEHRVAAVPARDRWEVSIGVRGDVVVAVEVPRAPHAAHGTAEIEAHDPGHVRRHAARGLADAV